LPKTDNITPELSQKQLLALITQYYKEYSIPTPILEVCLQMPSAFSGNTCATRKGNLNRFNDVMLIGKIII
jgi:hypothetical protein